MNGPIHTGFPTPSAVDMPADPHAPAAVTPSPAAPAGPEPQSGPASLIDFYREKYLGALAELESLTRQNQAQADAVRELEKERDQARGERALYKAASLAAERQRDAAYELLREVRFWPVNRKRGWAAIDADIDSLLAAQPAPAPADKPAWVPEIGEVCEVVNVDSPDISSEFDIGTVCIFLGVNREGLWNVERVDGKRISPGGLYPWRFRPLPKPEREPWIENKWMLLSDPWAQCVNDQLNQFRRELDELRAKVEG
jgi:hypothetical protein